MQINSTRRLANGVEMPRLGLGVYKVGNEEVAWPVRWALEAGYRSIDTASFYGNEAGVGRALKESGRDRSQVFLTSKVWNSEQGYSETLSAFDRSLDRLGVDYLDLYLIHWPVPGKFHETWRALERIYREKRVRAIGVSNFQIHHLEELSREAEVIPMVNQVELHPWMSQAPLRAYCQGRNIAVEAWAPLARGRFLDEPLLKDIGARHGKNAAQVILRWHLQNDVIAIPKSVHRERIIGNADIFDFELSAQEMGAIEGLNEDRRTGPDPDNVNF
ncbi:MAG TPA: aldo/keto reductase [Syntrophomonadaceae bacterium]|nr:aldo/keto reductase [Syntrophomonadaceae bacterium]